jgi:precorrin-6A/cobalt-precorrin-6A reductase
MAKWWPAEDTKNVANSSQIADKAPVVLIFGGTTEAASLADKLVRRGCTVVVSTATDEPSVVDRVSDVKRICGRCDTDGMKTLVTDVNADAAVVAVHPFAAQARANAISACARLNMPCLVFKRSGSNAALSDPQHQAEVQVVNDHQTAAQLAVANGETVMATVGTRQLKPYVDAAQQAGVRLYARVLNSETSIQTCLALGLPRQQIMALRGPFSVTANIEQLHQTGSHVLVTKDSGRAGGVPEKLEAAAKCQCRVILVAQPQETTQAHVFDHEDELVQQLFAILNVDL